MTAPAHTPGPWRAVHEAGHVSDVMTDNGGYRIDADGVEQLAFVWVLNRRLPADGLPQASGPTFGAVEATANANLIVAAPDLLAAAKIGRAYIAKMLEAVKHSDDPVLQGSRADFSKIEVAIAKAEGRA